MKVSPETWATVSKLFDEALDLDPADRAAWIERLDVSEPRLAPMVRKLLAAHGTSESADALAELPAITLTRNSASVSALAAGTLVGPYRLKREIGSGGMADLWLAERADGAFERDVALKLPRLTRLRRDLAERFAHERNILARLEHPYIARFYDAGVTEDGLPFLAMEFVDGRRITQWCDERTLDVAGRLKLLDQVLEAVQFAHANLIIHRDLKPSNILVTESGQVRLLDFGIAKLLAEGNVAEETPLTQLSGRALTPEYASPEQVRGEALTTATDVYSLGVVLYELLTGKMPYRLTLTSAAQLEQAIVDAIPSRPSAVATAEHARCCGLSEQRLRRALAGDLDTIVLKALAKDPAHRYGAVTELAQDLKRHLAGETVHARPASWRYRARSFVRRNRVAVGAAGAISLALIAGASVSLWQAQRARAQAELTRQQAARAEEVKNFVLSIFLDADTARGGSRSTTALDLLQQARHRLETEPVTDPGITAELLNSVGYSMIGLGESVEATPVLEEAARLSAEHLGTDHPTTISSRLNLGEAYIANDRTGDGERVISAALESSRRIGDMKHLVESLRWMCSVRAEQRNYDEARKFIDESLQLANTKLTDADKHTVMLVQWTFADLLWRMRDKGALDAARRTYELARDYWHGEPTPDVLAARSFYAVVLGVQGNAQDAVAELRAVRDEQAKLFGGISYQDVVRTNKRIGAASRSMGDPSSAIAAYREALEGLAEQTGGGAPTEVANGHLYLGAALIDARRFDEAERELRKAAAIFEPLKHGGLIEAQWFLGSAMTHEGRLAEAETMFAPSLAEPPKSEGDLARFKLELGRLRNAQGRHAEAIELLGQSRALYLKGGSSSAAALALGSIGRAQLAAGDTAAAAGTLQESVTALDTLHPLGSADQADLLVELSRARLSLGDAKGAVTAANRAEAFWNGFDPRNRRAEVARQWHSRALAQGQAESQTRATAR